ncbi:SsgA family sporulation/cell division regulator [Streptomyces lasiicapitis]|uniref:SsgA family sporulation/cell division regulator n=1 Tax=Streptomyces lasiicapitis TaxID=1923961 RepID=UPI0036AF4A50
MEAEVRATVFMELETGEQGGGRAPLSADFAYAAADPFAVTMTFYCDGDEVTRWRLDRDLLTAGCARPAGEGDVRVAPTSDPERGDGVRIELLGTPGPAGRSHAVLHAAAADLTAFLATAHAVVPPGEERVSLDELLDCLGQDESTYGEHAA